TFIIQPFARAAAQTTDVPWELPPAAAPGESEMPFLDRSPEPQRQSPTAAPTTDQSQGWLRNYADGGRQPKGGRRRNTMLVIMGLLILGGVSRALREPAEKVADPQPPPRFDSEVSPEELQAAMDSIRPRKVEVVRNQNPEPNFQPVPRGEEKKLRVVVAGTVSRLDAGRSRPVGQVAVYVLDAPKDRMPPVAKKPAVGNWCLSADDGSFRLPHPLPPGTYKLRFLHGDHGRGEKQVTVKGDEKELKVELEYR